MPEGPFGSVLAVHEAAEQAGGGAAEWAGDWLWDLDNVVLRTVGIDIGSSTSHLTFSRVRMQRRSRELSTRYVIVDREVVWRSDVLLTPYTSEARIDAGVLDAFFAAAYRDAGVEQHEIDTGAVILTGEALKRENARALADLFAAKGGRFVCATAGHHLEAVFSAHGSGAVAASRAGGRRILSVDIGGGTSKLSLVDGGRVVSTAALEVGGRLLACDGDVIVRLEQPMRRLAGSLGFALEVGDILGEDTADHLSDALVRSLVAAIDWRWNDEHVPALLVTPPMAVEARPESISFCGGVAEYLYDPDLADHGDLGRRIAEGLRLAIADGRLPAPVEVPENLIRATVTGCSQFSVQVSGSTVAVDQETELPLHNVPIVDPGLDLTGALDADVIASEVRRSAERVLGEHMGVSWAIGLQWGGAPEYDRLSALARGLVEGTRGLVGDDRALIVVIDSDIGMGLGGLLRRERGPGSGGVICLDGLTLKELDYIDIGRVIVPAGVVPVVVKSLLF